MGKPDLSEFEELGKPPPKPCRVAMALERLEGDEQDQLRAAVASTHIRPRAVENWCAKREIVLGLRSVTDHRSGKCSCA